MIQELLVVTDSMPNINRIDNDGGKRKSLRRMKRKTNKKSKKSKKTKTIRRRGRR